MMYTAVIIVNFVTCKSQSKRSNIMRRVTLVGLVACCLVPMVHWYQVTKEIHGSEVAIGWILKIVFNLLTFLNGFILYTFSIPERFVKGNKKIIINLVMILIWGFFVGTFDYIGASHQLWHFLVLYGLYRFRVIMIDYHENDEIHHCDKWQTLF